MTTLWTLDPAEDGESIDGTRNSSDDYLEFTRNADGRSFSEIWRLPTIMTFAKGRNHRRKKQKPLQLRADVPSGYSSLLLMRQRTREAIGPLIEPYGEFLPTVSLDEEPAYWVFNPLVVIDAIDFNACEVSRLSSGRIYYIDKLVLTDSPDVSVPVFRLKDDPSNHIFVNDTFRDAWLAKGLTGIEFRKIWERPEPL